MPEVGDLIANKYRIERPLASGGMGSVFVGVHVETGRQFAIKILSSMLSGDEEAEERFLREAKLANSIDHPYIIEIYDIGRDGPHQYMVMELLKGESLGERLKRGAVAPAEAVDIILKVLEAVAVAHEAGVVHRDLKPDNIFLTLSEDGGVEPKLLDFGISKLMTQKAQTRALTQTGVALGTPLYMSAEQVRGASEVDQRTDIYAMGVILYEMLSGEVPYKGNTYPDLVLKIITGDAQPIRQLKPELPAALGDVCGCALALEREDRYPDARTMMQALGSLGLGTVRPTARVSAVSPPASVTPFTAETPMDGTPAGVPGAGLSGGAKALFGVLGAAAGLGLILLLMPGESDTRAPLAPAPLDPHPGPEPVLPSPTPSPNLAESAQPGLNSPDAGVAPRAKPPSRDSRRAESARVPREHRPAPTPASTPANSDTPTLVITPVAPPPAPLPPTQPPPDEFRVERDEIIDPF